MGIHFSVKKRKRSMDYLFVDDVSVDCYENALFRINFKYDSDTCITFTTPGFYDPSIYDFEIVYG